MQFGSGTFGRSSSQGLESDIGFHLDTVCHLISYTGPADENYEFERNLCQNLEGLELLTYINLYLSLIQITMASTVAHLMLASVLLTHAAGQVDVKLADNHQGGTLECTVTFNLSSALKINKMKVTKNINATFDELIAAVPHDTTQNTIILTQGASGDAGFNYHINQTTHQITYVLNVGFLFENCQLKACYLCDVEYTWNGLTEYESRSLVPECKEPAIPSVAFTRLEQVLISVSVVFGFVIIVIPAIAFFRKHTNTCFPTSFQTVHTRCCPRMEATTEDEGPDDVSPPERDTDNPSLFEMDMQPEINYPIPDMAHQHEQHFN